MVRSQPNDDTHLYVNPEHSRILQFVVLEKIPGFVEARNIYFFEPLAPTPTKQSHILFPDDEGPSFFI